MKPQQSCFFPEPGEEYDPVLALNRMDNAREAAALEAPPVRPTLPYQPHSETSREAAVQAEPKSHTQRHAVLRVIRSHGPCTDEFVQEILEMNPSTQRPRRIELVEGGLVRDSGRTAKTRSGRKAVLWESIDERKA